MIHHNGVPVITLAADLTPAQDGGVFLTVGQYLFTRPDGDVELWRLNSSGWFDAGGVHYDSPLKRNPGLTQWQRVGLGAR